jgi:hypothetical protein
LSAAPGTSQDGPDPRLHSIMRRSVVRSAVLMNRFPIPRPGYADSFGLPRHAARRARSAFRLAGPPADPPPEVSRHGRQAGKASRGHSVPIILPEAGVLSEIRDQILDLAGPAKLRAIVAGRLDVGEVEDFLHAGGYAQRPPFLRASQGHQPSPFVRDPFHRPRPQLRQASSMASNSPCSFSAR